MTKAVRSEDDIARCPWGSAPGVLRDYHDTEWGVPILGESAMFERLSLEGAQAGLSWLTILNKRENYRSRFLGFDVDRVAAMTDADLAEALLDPGIVRNRGKVASVRTNARAAVELRADGGLEAFIESFAPARTPRPADTSQVPTTSPESLALSKALKKRGFAFVGPTTMYALFEASGIVDTHLTGCHRRGVAARWPA
ncbi:DNA-3-methyladenine glycosylase I [Marmoricola sp. OAE513]|uniref:DNA-3-methyladenine glycosylase I n=1 Tax=Marmoricola sp. OAE513 TaxID=2817894 RepID=UPI001AE9F0D6